MISETEKAQYFVQLQEKMAEFIEELPEGHRVGYLPDNITEQMAKSALSILENTSDCNDYFERECHIFNK